MFAIAHDDCLFRLEDVSVIETREVLPNHSEGSDAGFFCDGAADICVATVEVLFPGRKCLGCVDELVDALKGAPGLIGPAAFRET